MHAISSNTHTPRIIELAQTISKHLLFGIVINKCVPFSQLIVLSHTLREQLNMNTIISEREQREHTAHTHTHAHTQTQMGTLNTT